MRTYSPDRIHSFKCESHIRKEVKITRRYILKGRIAEGIVYAERTNRDDILIVPIGLIRNLKQNSPYGFTGEVKGGEYYIDGKRVKLYDAHSVYNGEGYVRVDYNAKFEDKTPVEFMDITEDRLDNEKEKGNLDEGMYEICSMFRRLGVKSIDSCNGHGKKKAQIKFSTKTNKKYLEDLLKDEDYIDVIEVESDICRTSYIRIEFDFSDENRKKIMDIEKKHWAYEDRKRAMKIAEKHWAGGIKIPEKYWAD